MRRNNIKEFERKVSIITANYNGEKWLKDWLPSVFNQKYRKIEVIVVDNNSSDQSISYIEKNYPEVRILKNKVNNGFAKANNQGALKARGEFLFLLNNDTKLFSNTITELVKTYKPKSILTAYQISMRDKKTGRAGAGSDIFGYPYVEINIPQTKIFYADGAALFIKKEDFIDIGMFDDELFMFQEDIDLSWRAQIMGYQIIPCLNAKLYHYFGGTAEMKFKSGNKYTSSYFRRYLNERNVIRNILKNYSFPLIIFILIMMSILHIIEVLFFLLMRQFKVAECYIKAYVWNIQNIKNTLEFRRAKVQKRRTVSDFTLMKRMYFFYAKLKILPRVGIPDFQ